MLKDAKYVSYSAVKREIIVNPTFYIYLPIMNKWSFFALLNV